MSTTVNIIESAGKRQPIVCFAGCDWWYHNRGLFCAQVMKKLAKNYKVLFVNSLGMRIPSFKKDRNAVGKVVRKLRSIFRFLKKNEHGMYVLSPVSIPFASRLGRKLNTYCVFLQVKLVSVLLGFKKPVVYIGCPPALEIAKKLRQRQFMIYERTDLFEEMPGAEKPYIAALDKELAETADLVLYVNRALWDEGVKKNKNSMLIGHGVDYDFFVSGAESKFVPEDIAQICRPIVGFYGDISDKTSDLALLKFAAEKMPEVPFVLVGPVSADVAGLKKCRNVYFLGQKPYEQIPFYGKMFDVAIMPWNKSKWIEFCNPIKIKEYLALGKPIVSMYYPEIEPYRDVVYVAQDYDSFVSRILEAVKENNPAMKQLRRERVRNETWDSKVEQIVAVMERDLNKGKHQASTQ